MSRGIIVITTSVVIIFAALTSPSAYATINVEIVTVGDPGNPGELSGTAPSLERICGAVNYTYQIGKFEISNSQYMVFLNSVAKYGDTYNLFKAGLSDYMKAYQGIQRTGAGTSGNPYVYSVKNGDPNWDNKPVNFVSYYDTLRFVNWLQNGQPVGDQIAGVTETGTYTFSGATTVTIIDHSALTTPHYVLPNEDEWYKAAFYKGGDSNAGYWDYATRSDNVPDNNPPWLDTGNSANYYGGGDNYTIGQPYYLTNVGAYTLSESAYGTYDQNGNVFEWCDKLPSDTTPDSITRGGGWMYYQEGLISSYRDPIGPQQYGSEDGFRIALVPEPVTFSVTAVGWILLFAIKMRRK